MTFITAETKNKLNKSKSISLPLSQLLVERNEKLDFDIREEKKRLSVVETFFEDSVVDSTVKTKKMKKQYVEMMLEILVDNQFKHSKYRKLHRSYTKFFDTEDIGIISVLNKVNKQQLEELMLKNYNNIGLYNFKREGKDLSGLSLFSYGGTKTNYNVIQQNVMREILKNNKIDTYVDCMVGGFGSFLSLSPLLKEYGIKVVLNDYNKKTINIVKQIKNNLDGVLNVISDVCRVMYLKFGGNELGLYENEEMRKELFNYLKETVNEKERRGEFDLVHGTYLLIMGNIPFTGSYEVKVENSRGLSKKQKEIEKMKGNTVSSYSHSRDPKKYRSVFDKLHKTVEIYHKIFNDLNVKFTTKDYKKVMKEYDSETTLFLMDPPYTECEKKYNLDMSIEEYKNGKTPINSCSYNYGLDWNKKQHLEVLDSISKVKGEVIYWNYRHTIVKLYEKYNNFTGYGIDFKEGTTGKDKINYIMWSNKKKSKFDFSNNKYYSINSELLVS